MSKDNYLSISELIHQLKVKAEKLDQGKITANQFSDMIANTSELYDRLVILRYKAYEEEIKFADGKELPKANTPKKTPKKEKKPFSSAFQLDFDQQAAMAAEENIVPRNQVNLMDAIAKEEAVTGEPVPFQPEPKLDYDEEIVEVVPTQEAVSEESVEAEPQKEEDQAPQDTSEAEETPANAIEVPQTPEDTSSNALDDSSINARILFGEVDESLAEKLGMSPIENIKDAIGINQKFLFMNELFSGERDAFHEALDALNSCNGLEAAQGVAYKLGDQHDWDWEAEITRELLNLIERRYMLNH